MKHIVRSAEDGDRRALAEMLARAFWEDPVVAWIRPDRSDRRARSIASFEYVFDAEAAGLRLTTPGLEAASLWRLSREDERQCAPRDAGEGPVELPDDPAARRGQILHRSLERHMPAGDFWCLHVAGCEPSMQGRGFAKAVITEGLNRIGAARAYLETANPDNLPFYGAAGFCVAESWTLLEGGPTMWSMLREAGG